MKRTYLFLALFFGLASARAQLFDAAMGHAELLATLIGKERAFTATLIVERERTGKTVVIAEGPFAICDGNVRMELAISKLPTMKDERRDKLREDGLAKTITILLPAVKKALLLLPARKAYLEAQLAGEDMKPSSSAVTALQVVDGRSCVVRRVTVAGADESRSEITVWEDVEKEHLIVQSKMDNGDNTNTVLRFTKIDSTKKPATELFAAPAGYRKLSDKDAGAIAEKLSEFDLDRDSAITEALR